MPNRPNKKSSNGRSKATANLPAKQPAKKPVRKPAQQSARKPALAPVTGPSSKAPRLLSGGNPQIPKGDGDASVAAYLNAVPGWKQDVCRRLDALILAIVPHARRAVRWNSPFYGIDGQGWFLAYHCITKYVKVTFFKGTHLTPLPPEPSKLPDVRYVHLFEHDAWDEAQLASWIRQAASRLGERCF